MLSSLDTAPAPPLRALTAALQILSPISDKSQEPTSPASTPASPAPRPRPALQLDFGHQHQPAEAVVGGKTLRTPDLQQYLNVPWDIPKLKSKLKAKQRNNCFRGQSSR